MKRFYPVILALVLCCAAVLSAQAAQLSETTPQRESVEPASSEMESPSDGPTDPTDDPTDPMDPTDDPTDPTEDPTDPTEDPTDPADDPVPPEAFLMGDVDRNGEVTTNDARCILRAAVGLEAFSAEAAAYADADGNGEIRIVDARLVLRAALSLITPERHAFAVSELAAPTCTEDGRLQFACALCGLSGEMTLPPLPHAFIDTVDTPATCAALGKAIRTCENCDYRAVITLPKTAHTWERPEKNQAKRCTQCGMLADGWSERKGRACYYDADGELVKNKIVDGAYLDDTGCRCDDAVIKAAVEFATKHGGSGSAEQKLANCFNYIIKTYGYKTIHGLPTAASLPDTALAMFRGTSGNCYSFASLLAYVGKVLGYPARIDSGKVLSSGVMAPHGWTELQMDGVWYLFDAVRQKYYHIDGFKRTHENFAAVHTHGQYFTLITENGEAYWK